MGLSPISATPFASKIALLPFVQKGGGYPSVSTLSQECTKGPSCFTWIYQKVSTFFSWVWSLFFSSPKEQEKGDFSFFKQIDSDPNQLIYSLLLNNKRTENKIFLEKGKDGLLVLNKVTFSDPDYRTQIVPMMQFILEQETASKVVVTRLELAKILADCGWQTTHQIPFYTHPDTQCIHRPGKKGTEYVDPDGRPHVTEWEDCMNDKFKKHVVNRCLQGLGDQGIQLIIKEARSKEKSLTVAQKTALEALEKQMQTLTQESLAISSDEELAEIFLPQAEKRLAKGTDMSPQERANLETCVAEWRQQLKASKEKRGLFGGSGSEVVHKQYAMLALSDLLLLVGVVGSKNSALRGIQFKEALFFKEPSPAKSRSLFSFRRGGKN